MKSMSFLAICVVFSLLVQTSISQAAVVATATQGKCVCMDLTNPSTADTVQSDSRLRTRSSANTNYKSWLQFDLNAIYAANPDMKGHIKSATLTFTGTADNTLSKSYIVNGLNDAAGMENWNPAGLTWNNAPGNNTTDSYLDPSVTTANLYTGTIKPGDGVEDSQTSNALVSFLNTDSDGLVTFIMTPGLTAYFYNTGSIYPPTLTLSANTPIAFPGAEGFGKNAIGGRGGAVYEVTNLDNSGTGSLRAAIDASGPRIVVFRVSGYIELQSGLTINNPYITIAGQTAPGDGICLKNYGFTVLADHVIIRYMRFRLGDTYRKESDTVWVGKGHHIILDHCSTSWSVDETLSVTNDPNVLGDITVQWCMITESLNCSVHEKGCHGYGSLNRGGWGNGYSFHHNLYANHKGRNPFSGNYNSFAIDPCGLIFDFRNNVVYNWGSYAGHNPDSNSITKMNYVGNYYIKGPDSTSNYAFWQQSTNIYNRAYWSGNAMDGSIPPDQWNLVRFDGYTEAQKAAYKLSNPVFVPPVQTDDAITAYEMVLADAGAAFPVRDSIDARVIDGVINKTGRIINCVNGNNYYFPTAYAQAGTSNTITLAADASTYDNCYKGWAIEILAGTGAGQVRNISNYSGITKIATVSVNWNIVPDATSMYGRIVNCTQNAGGWPALASGTPPADNDHDGMPNAWEIAMCLDPNNAGDTNNYRSDGYTNIEAYINWLPSGEPMPAKTDLNCDGKVDFSDFSEFAQHWLSVYGSGSYDEKYDFSHNNIISMDDLFYMAQDWLNCNLSPAEECWQ
jgi:hypothetical protein